MDWRDEELYARIVNDSGIEEAKDDQIGYEEKSTVCDSSGSSNDNIPLAELHTRIAQQHRRPVKREILESESGYSDDSFQDESYNPDKDMANSSDSEVEEMVKVTRKRKRGYKNVQVRNKSWKKIPTTCTTSKQRTYQRKSKGNLLLEKLKKTIKTLKERRSRKEAEKKKPNINKALRLSKTLQTIKAHTRKIHEDRLDHLLSSNEIKRVPVASDGNCFFAAVARSVQDPELTDLNRFRNSVCDYMLQTKDRFCAFVTSVSEEMDQTETFIREVESLRRSGQWNASIADCLPVEIAEIYNSILRIYSSSLATPVIDIKPTDSTADNGNRRIEIAYLAIRQEEHYDATMPAQIPSSEKSHLDVHSTITTDQSVLANEHLTPQKKMTNSTVENAGKRTDTTVTPHKRADYESPPKKHSSRKKKRNFSAWKSNVRKTLKCQGKPYVSKAGKNIDGKCVQKQDCDKCKFKCNKKFTESERKEIFEIYYKLPNYERQRCFICDMITKETPIRKSSGRRQNTLKYHLVLGDRKERVCRNFFCKTLNVGRKLISYTLARKEHRTFHGEDTRGRKAPATKISENHVNFIRAHINSFPRMESHYTRKSSNKQYLSHGLNIKQMWRLYSDLCKEKGRTAAKESKYRQIFCEDFNLSFYKPKKDQCSLCAKYSRHKEMNSLTEELKEEYNLHQQKKIEAREEKENDKQKAKTNMNYI